MQPIYLTGHSRPVRKCQFNFDGDLLFTCSDDGTVCMYRTYDCQRIGVFPIKEACKSIDISKDSKWLLATGTTRGVQIFSIEKGTLEAAVKIPSAQTLYFKQVEFNLGDTKYLLVHDKSKKSFVQIFDFKNAFKKENNDEIELEIQGPQDHIITQASWGFLNKTLYFATDKGRFLVHDLESNDTLIEKDIHKTEIFSFTLTYDHSMIITCSRDGTAKLLNRNTLHTFREFNFNKPCRAASISPLFDNQECQKFHVLLAGGQDAKEVTTTKAKEGGFGIQLMSIILNESLAEITGHFGTVHTLAFSPDGTSFASGSEDGYVHYHKFLPEYFTKKFE